MIDTPGQGGGEGDPNGTWGSHLQFSSRLRLGLSCPAGGSLSPCSARPCPSSQAQPSSARSFLHPAWPVICPVRGRAGRVCSVWVEFRIRSSQTPCTHISVAGSLPPLTGPALLTSLSPIARKGGLHFGVRKSWFKSRSCRFLAV